MGRTEVLRQNLEELQSFKVKQRRMCPLMEAEKKSRKSNQEEKMVSGIQGKKECFQENEK